MIITFTDIDTSNKEQLIEVYTTLSPYFERYDIVNRSENASHRKVMAKNTNSGIVFHVVHFSKAEYAVIREEFTTATQRLLFTVLRGSNIVKTNKPTLTDSQRKARENYFKEGIIREDNIVLKDLYPVSALSSALALIRGFNASSSSAKIISVQDATQQRLILEELEKRVSQGDSLSD